MPRDWDDIPQESWDDITLYVNDSGQWHVEFDYTGRNGVEYHYPRTPISYDHFIDIYEMAADLDQELNIESDT
jgi:hypothetical protein